MYVLCLHSWLKFLGIHKEYFINTEQVLHQKHTNNRWKINVKVMEVYKGTKNNQNIRIIPDLSHLVERKQSNSRKCTFLQELTKN